MLNSNCRISCATGASRSPACSISTLVIRDGREPAFKFRHVGDAPKTTGGRFVATYRHGLEAAIRDSRVRSLVKSTISARIGSQKRPEGSADVRRPRSENEPRFPGSGEDESLGARQSQRTFAYGKAGAGAEEGRSPRPYRRGRDLRHRP